MFVKVTKLPNGRINIRLVEGYREPGTGKVKQRLIENLGYVDEYTHLYDDPVAHFRQVAKKRTLAEQAKKQEKLIHLGTVNADERLQDGEESLRYLGFLPLSSIYHELGIDQFFNNRQRSMKIEYSLNDVMQLLLYTRILYPASKRVSFAHKDYFPRPFKCELYDVYRALDYFAKYKDSLLMHLHERIRENYSRKTDVVYYDVTNYYFEIDQQDEFRRNGFCKYNKRKPLVQMGLLLDSDSLPITYRLFNGNTHDSQTLMPIIQTVRNNYDIGRIIVVADKALNSGDNVALMMVQGDGFIFSQKIRGASKAFQDYVFEQRGYQQQKGLIKQTDEWLKKDENKDKVAFKMKSRPFPQEFYITNADDIKRPLPLDVKQIVCYNELYARRQKYKRQELLEKARRIIAAPSLYSKSRAGGARAYIKNIQFDPKTGECVSTKSHLYLDEDLVKEEEKYDGYYSIITSECDMPDREIVQKYHELWEIERSFRITKTDLETRPVYVSLAKRIEGHFLTCFISLLILRLLDLRLEYKYSPEQIIQALRKYQACFIKDNVYKTMYFDQLIKELVDKLNLTLDKKYISTGDIRQMIGASKKKA